MLRRLVNADSAWVPIEKMTLYLLNPLNPRAGQGNRVLKFQHSLTRHSRESGNPFSLATVILAIAKIPWIPAFAGMTVSGKADSIKTRLPCRAGTKPNDFAEMGYDTQNVDVLERDLISVVRNNPVIDERTTPISITYRVEGYVTTPTGAERYIRTV